MKEENLKVFTPLILITTVRVNVYMAYDEIYETMMIKKEKKLLSSNDFELTATEGICKYNQ